jgi:hypothetical protein
MGHIKEPVGVDFVVDSTPLTKEDKMRISEVIAYYKATGKKMPLTKPTIKKGTTPSKKKTLV